MRVLLSGTSNSVLAKGINYTFPNDPAVAAFTNHSYGASGTVALGDHLRKIDFSQHDFCVLDYCVNEEVFIWQKDSTPEAAMNNLYAIIDAASQAGCQPIVMIFPSSTRANHKRPFEEGITDQLMARGVPVFNFYRFAERIAAQSDLTFSDLFLDPMHVRRELGQFMGHVAIEYMKSVADAGAAPLVNNDLSYQPLGFVPFEQIVISGERNVVHHETKLAAADFLRVSPDNTMTVSAQGILDGAVDVIGLTYNATRTIGKLQDSATQEPILQIKPSALFAENRRLTLVSRPVSHPLHMADGTADIAYYFDGETTEKQPAPAVELAGFVLRSAQTRLPVHIATHATAPVALEDTVSDADLTALVDMLKATPAA